MFKIITANRLQTLLNEYGDIESGKLVTIHAHFRGIYSARLFGFCILRHELAWKELKSNGMYLKSDEYQNKT